MRIGKKTGPGRLRSTAITRAKARMNTSATQKILMLSQKARRISGNDSRKISGLKNAALTSGQPGALVITRTRTAKKTTVLTSAIATLRESALIPPRILDRRSPSMTLELWRYWRTGALALSESQV